VISIAGLYRTGKSFLLNRVILKQKFGFDVDQTVNACTKGIWIWNQVLEGTYDGRKIKVIIADTEGLASNEATQNHDLRIFTLAILTCSTFIYNSQKTIDKDALNKLELCVKLSK